MNPYCDCSPRPSRNWRSDLAGLEPCNRPGRRGPVVEAERRPRSIGACEKEFELPRRGVVALIERLPDPRRGDDENVSFERLDPGLVTREGLTLVACDPGEDRPKLDGRPLLDRPPKRDGRLALDRRGVTTGCVCGFEDRGAAEPKLLRRDGVLVARAGPDEPPTLRAGARDGLRRTLEPELALPLFRPPEKRGLDERLDRFEKVERGREA